MEMYSISIHAPRMGCDPILDCAFYVFLISIHAPRMGCDFVGNIKYSFVHKFQSTHPVWGATMSSRKFFTEVTFQSTHPVWGATMYSCRCSRYHTISIHAPRMGCDIRVRVHFLGQYGFQSTHPVWGATILL